MEKIINDLLEDSSRFWLLDGAMGTQLQKKGLPFGLQPELFNLSHPEIVTGIHREYIEAGSNIIYANTFGANRKKLSGCGHSVQEVITAAVQKMQRLLPTHQQHRHWLRWTSDQLGSCSNRLVHSLLKKLTTSLPRKLPQALLPEQILSCWKP